jgi:enoyl-CoA hydratase/carnithine racemase
VSGTYETQGGIAVVTMDTPPVNSLGLDNRRFIQSAIARAQADANVKAVVLTGAGRAFSGGADIREFGLPTSTEEPHLMTLIRMIEDGDKLVVAAIHGVVMGGGLELACGQQDRRRARRHACPQGRARCGDRRRNHGRRHCPTTNPASATRWRARPWST